MGSRTPIIDLLRPLAWALARLYFGLELRGTEHIPRTGPVLILPNHQTYADPPLVTIPIRRRVHYMAWSRLFGIPGLGWLIPGSVPSRWTSTAPTAGPRARSCDCCGRGRP